MPRFLLVSQIERKAFVYVTRLAYTARAVLLRRSPT
jgi:hypothetical protein